MNSPTLPLSFNPAGIELDRGQGLSRQLYQALRQRVLDGRLASGTRLPASRDLAAALRFPATAWCAPTTSCTPRVLSKAGSATAPMWRNYPRAGCRSKSRRKIYPQKYPQGYHQAYPQVYPQKREFTWDYIQ